MIPNICFQPFRAILQLRFGAIINDGPIFRVNLVGIGLNMVYMTFYYWHINTAKDRKSFWTQFLMWTVVGVIVIAYSFYEDPINLQKRYGMILTVILFYFVGSPLLKLVSIEEKFCIQILWIT